jgi:hypothetical protein
MADFGITEAVLLAASLAATAAGTGVSLYSADQSNKAQAAAANRAANANADNQQKANEAAASYRAQQEQQRVSAYLKAQEERDRQKQMQNEADATFRKSASEATKGTQDANTANAAADLRRSYAPSADTGTDIPGVNTEAVATDDAGTRVVAGGYKDALKKVSAFLGGNADAQAGLDARTSAGLKDSIFQARQQGALDKITNFMRGSAAVLPAELQASNTARGLIDQEAAANMALYQDKQGIINENAVRDVNAASHAGDTGASIGSLLTGVGQLGASYTGNALGKKTTVKPKPKPVTIS